MPEYNIGFSKCLIQAADFVSHQGMKTEDAMRTVLYLSKLATEIAVKSLLEKAGKPINEITNYGHNLDKLLMELGKCQVQDRDNQKHIVLGSCKPHSKYSG